MIQINQIKITSRYLKIINYLKNNFRLISISLKMLKFLSYPTFSLEIIKSHLLINQKYKITNTKTKKQIIEVIM